MAVCLLSIPLVLGGVSPRLTFIVDVHDYDVRAVDASTVYRGPVHVIQLKVPNEVCCHVQNFKKNITSTVNVGYDQIAKRKIYLPAKKYFEKDDRLQRNLT